MDRHKLHEVFSTEKNYLDFESKGGGRDEEEEEQTPDGQYQPIWALPHLDWDAQTWQGR